MNQTEQVIAAMKNLGGYATLGQLNLSLDFSTWKTQTPQASVRRIVQTCGKFDRVQPGLWTLKTEKKSIQEKLQIDLANEEEKREFTHAYIQGVLVQIGNMKGMQTCVPPQDRQRRCMETPLANLVTLKCIYQFTYPEIQRYAATIDVVWFNERRLPHSFFEVEHSTDIKNSLSKFYELQDYYVRFCIVADTKRRKQFDEIMCRSLYQQIRERVDFIDYENLANQFDKMYELSQVKQVL